MITIAKYDEIAEKKDDAAFKQISADLYWAYHTSKRLGSDDLVLDDVKWTKEVAPIVKECREYGIKQIAFTSTWSGAIDTIWEFIKNGCSFVKIELGKRYHGEFVWQRRKADRFY